MPGEYIYAKWQLAGYSSSLIPPPSSLASMQVKGVALERRERRVLEDLLVGRLEHDARRHPRLPRLDPAQHVQAPAVAGLQAPESHLGTRRREVVAAAL